MIEEKLRLQPSQVDKVAQLPLFPTEQAIWDPHLVPDEHFRNEFSLALPKLNLQFLTIHDYLLRNFHLYRLETTYGIRDDVRDCVARMRPYRAPVDPGLEMETQLSAGLEIKACLGSM